MVLYDVSSSYYEGHTCPLVSYGYNRDDKRGLPIIVYGVLTDRAGRPVAVDVYPAIRGPLDGCGQVQELRRRFGLSRLFWSGTGNVDPSED